MAIGTGLPIPKETAVLAEAPGGTNAAALFNADSWNKIAAAGEKLQTIGGDQIKLNEHQAQVGYLSDQDVAIQRKQIEYRNQYANDPKGFDTAWSNYAEGVQGSAAPWAVNHVRATLGSTGNTAYSAILNETRVQTEADAKKSWAALEDTASNDVTGHAMAGSLATPAGQIAIQKYRGVIATGVTSQFIPQAVGDQHIAQLESAATVYATRTGIKSTFEASGPIDAVKQIDDIVRDPKLQLSPDQRLSLGARLRADVHGWDAERTQNLGNVDLESQSLIRAKQGGVPIPQSRIDDVVDRYKRFGGQAQAATFLADIQHSDDLSFLGRVPVPEAAAWIDRYKTERGFNGAVNMAIPPEGRALLDRIASGESAGRYDVRYGGAGDKTFAGYGDHPRIAEPITSGPDVGKTSTAAGRYQFIAPTWDAQKQKLGLPDFSPPNQDAAAWDLAQTEYKTKTGKDLLSVLKSGDAAAISDVPRQLSGQWSSLPGGRQPAPYSAATASNVTFIGKANTLVAKRIVDDADAIVAGMNSKDSPVLPSEQRINDLLTAAAATNTPEVLDKVSRAAADYQFRRQFGRAPEPQEAATVTGLQQKAVTEGLSTTDARRLDIAQQVHDRTAKALQDDPLSHTVAALGDTARMAPPAPLNVGDSAAFRAGLQTRAQWAGLGTQTFMTAPMPALTATDLTQVNAALEAANPAAKAQIYSDIVRSLPPETRAATLAQLGSKGATAAVEAAAGGLMAEAPDIAQSILRGQLAIKTDKNFGPDVKPADFQQEMMQRLPPGTFSLAGRTDATGPYAVARDAVKARYADLSAQSNDVSGKLSNDRLQQAIDDVTGGVLHHNGGTFIAPARGMPQKTFDYTLWGVTDADLGHGGMPNNLAAANAALNLTPQEQALYERHLSNLTGPGGVTNANGSRSTLFVNTFGIGDKTVVVPSVWDGKILKPDEALARAKAEGLDNFPSYGSDAEANARYGKMHDFMEKDTAQYNKGSTTAVTTLNGQPVNADYLRSTAQLESIGDGRYLMRLGGDPLRPIYAYTGANTETPQKFVLDLRGKTATPEGIRALQNYVAPLDRQVGAALP